MGDGAYVVPRPASGVGFREQQFVSAVVADLLARLSHAGVPLTASVCVGCVLADVLDVAGVPLPWALRTLVAGVPAVEIPPAPGSWDGRSQLVRTVAAAEWDE